MLIEIGGHLRVAQGELDGRLQIAQLAAAVEARAAILLRQHLLVGEQRLDPPS